MSTPNRDSANGTSTGPGVTGASVAARAISVSRDTSSAWDSSTTPLTDYGYVPVRHELWATMTIGEMIWAILRRTPSVLFFTILIAALVIASVSVWPNSYRSEGVMFVRQGRASLNADVTASPTQNVSVQNSRRSVVVSIKEILCSRAIAEQVVDEVGVDEILQPRCWMDNQILSLTERFQDATSAAGDISNDEIQRQLSREEAIARIQSGIDVQLKKDSYTLGISATEKDPHLAQQIAQSLIDNYQRYHVQAHRSTGSLDFFQLQVQQSEKRALETQKTLQQARAEARWMTNESADISMRQRLISLNTQYDVADSSHAAAVAESTRLADQIAGLAPTVSSEVTRGIGNRGSEEMRNSLYEAELKQNEMLSKLGPDHPKRKMILDKMRADREIYDSAEDLRTQTKETLNPIRLELETKYRQMLAKADGLKRQRESLKEGISRAEAEQQRLIGTLANIAQ
ncbi:MAG: hypothetical protein AAFN70_04625, partial [Planctomycetota bacterium]